MNTFKPYPACTLPTTGVTPTTPTTHAEYLAASYRPIQPTPTTLSEFCATYYPSSQPNPLTQPAELLAAHHPVSPKTQYVSGYWRHTGNPFNPIDWVPGYRRSGPSV
jgi:hypothetical protein